ncbi:MAG: glycosyltransferase [Kangiella sp.]|nr:glycosyltransferase [Kangiella sp.]
MEHNEKKEVVRITISEYQDLVNKQVSLKSEINEVRNSTSYRLGNTLVNSLKSWRGMLSLPKALYLIYKDARSKQNFLLTHGYKLFGAPVREPIAKPKSNISSKDISTIQELLKGKINGRKVRMAAIMDEFTSSSFAPECELLLLTPDNYLDELENFKPDLLFIESAWKGKDKLWERKVSTCTEEVVGCIDWCFDNNIPTLLWNKEDPVHYNSFLPLARFVDYVFTTDFDSIPKYKAALGHERVFVLPFAAQPKYHNPIEKYHRKDIFNFAGSYYVRFPERKADFKKLIAVADSYKGVEIYDRNYKTPHPHFEFPDEYRDKIIGGLPFSEIDKAYKGYKFGININTIKQSQSMFARRVFELMASNTVVLSNYSRGVREFFGDLVIASDDTSCLIRSLKEFVSNELDYKKYRLLGLRKVMNEHTYAHRLNFILAKLTGKPYINDKKQINVFAVVDNANSLRDVVKNFEAQSYSNKLLHILYKSSDCSVYDHSDEISCTNNEQEFIEHFRSLKPDDICSIFNSGDHYGSAYLEDMSLAFNYSDAQAITKSCFFKYENNEFVPLNLNNEYKIVSEAHPFRTVFKRSVVSNLTIIELLSKKNILDTSNSKALSIDCFNYCENTIQAKTDVDYGVVSDLSIADRGVSTLEHFDEVKVNGTFEIGFRSGNGSIVSLRSDTLKEILPPFTDNFTVEVESGLIKVISELEIDEDESQVLFFNKFFTREELNLLSNNQFYFDIESTFDGAFSVFEFYDYNNNLISTQNNPIDGAHYSLSIPPLCTYIRLGVQCLKAGELLIKQIIIGQLFEIPSTVVGKSETLVLTNQYPSYENLYRFGFLHSRIKGYKDSGRNVDIFRLTNEGTVPFREFEGIDIAQGDISLLDRTLATGQYKYVLVHLLDNKMWSVLSKYIDDIKVIVWAHGAEIQLWNRREFEFERMSTAEVGKQKKLSDLRKKFWLNLLKEPHPNLKLVFVSEYFKNEVFTDFGVTLPDEQVKVIHNYINDKRFPYSPKSSELRKKILSIRPYASRKYANDLTIKTILELSKRNFFNELDFCLVGDGPLFDELTSKVSSFKNVKLKKGFLNQADIAELHKSYGIFLTPTRMDSQGVSRDEAMSSGLVPITNCVAAIPEFLDDSSGFMVPSEDYKAMADAIEALFKDEKLFLQMSVNASLRVRKQCGLEATIKKEMKLFDCEK